MMLKRVMGKASFATVQDMSGRIQFYINDEGVSAETHDAFQALGHGRHHRSQRHPVQNQ